MATASLVENAEILAAAADEAMLFLDARYIWFEQEDHRAGARWGTTLRLSKQFTELGLEDKGAA